MKHILLYVMLTIFLFFFPNAFLIAEGQNDNEFTETQVVDFLKQVEKKYKVYITYEKSIINIIKEIDLNNTVLEKDNADDALKLLFKDSKIKYQKLRDDYFILTEEKSEEQNSSIFLPDSIKTVKGIVLDENKVSLPGATVSIKNTTIGTITNFEGLFEIEAATNNNIVVSFIGYKSKEVKPGSDFLTIQLEPDIMGLDEIVVSGVADNTPTKKLTVSVVKVKSDRLNEAPASSAAAALQGKVAGVQIKSAFGQPGTGARQPGAGSQIMGKRFFRETHEKNPK